MTHYVRWKPTEEELVSLGFDVKGVFEVFGKKHVNFSHHYGLIFRTIDGENSGVFVGDVIIYPKSLEELRSLISMMKP